MDMRQTNCTFVEHCGGVLSQAHVFSNCSFVLFSRPFSHTFHVACDFSPVSLGHRDCPAAISSTPCVLERDAAADGQPGRTAKSLVGMICQQWARFPKQYCHGNNTKTTNVCYNVVRFCLGTAQGFATAIGVGQSGWRCPIRRLRTNFDQMRFAEK